MSVSPAKDATHLTKAVRNDSLWLFSGYAATAGVGFVFWILAALRVPAAELGVDAAMISVFSAAAAVTSSGLSSGVLVMLPVAGEHRRDLLAYAHRAAAGFGVLAGLVAGLLAAGLLDWKGEPPVFIVLGIAVMTAVWALFNLKDSVLTGLGAARWTLFLNGPANLGKLLLTLAFTLPMVMLPHAVVWATIVPAAVAVGYVLWRLVPRLLTPPDLTPSDLGALLARFRSFAARDTVATGLLLGAGLVTPFVVTAASTPEQGALYALSYQLSVALDLVTSGVSTALAKNTSSDRAAGVRISVKLGVRVFALVLAAAVLLTAVTPVAFRLLGRGYDPNQATIVVGLLSAGCVLRSPYAIWSALVRAHHQVMPVLIANASSVVLLAVLLVLLVPVGGAVGAAAAVCGMAAWSFVVGVVGTRRMLRRAGAGA